MGLRDVIHATSIAAALLLMASTTALRAQTFHIKEFEFERGGWSFENINAVQDRFPINADRIRSGHELGLGYGLTSVYFPKILVSFEKPADADWIVQRAILENIFLLQGLARGRDGLGLAWFQSIEGRIDRHETNSTLFGPIVTAQVGKFSTSFNPFFEKTFGSNSQHGVAFNGNWQARYEVADGVRLGMEGYSLWPDFAHAAPVSQQQHRFGPMALIDWQLMLGPRAPRGDLEIGALFGVTDATPGITYKANAQVQF